MQALVDADIVAYRCASSADNDPLDIAIVRTDQLMRSILETIKADTYSAFLSGSNNFRKEIYPEYKAHRKDKPLPKHLNDCREFLVSEWKAKVTDGYEADDALGIEQDKEGLTTIIVSIDKDLLQIPGYHYNFVKNISLEVTKLMGIQQFYRQMLIGDTADNVKGVEGIGEKKASKLIDLLSDEEEMQQIVCGLYNDPDRFQINADVLWIMQEEGQQWSNRLR